MQVKPNHKKTGMPISWGIGLKIPNPHQRNQRPHPPAQRSTIFNAGIFATVDHRPTEKID